MNNKLFSQHNSTQDDVLRPSQSCGWVTNLTSTSKALSTYFERLSEYQLEASNELSRLAADPSHAPEAYATYMARLTQMYSEWQAAMQKLMADAQQLYEIMQRNVEGQLSAPGNTGLGTALAPGMKYGQARSENPGGPGDWRFDPAQGLPLMDASVIAPNPITATPASVTLSVTSTPAFPAMPSMPMMPLLTAFTTPSPASAAPPPDYTPDQDVLSARAELQHSVLPPAPPLPPAPQSGYTLPSICGSETAGIKYRCDAYRRVARAKL